MDNSLLLKKQELIDSVCFIHTDFDKNFLNLYNLLKIVIIDLQ